jgi:hypothetical protein
MVQEVFWLMVLANAEPLTTVAASAQAADAPRRLKRRDMDCLLGSRGIGRRAGYRQPSVHFQEKQKKL